MFIRVLVLFIISFSANAFYTDRPDAISYKLGTGDLAGYSKVYYICPTGDDTLNNGLSPSAPFKTYAKFLNIYNSLLGNEAVAFCRGGVFTISAAPGSISNTSTTISKTSPITIRDYQLPTGSTAPPKLVYTLTSGNVFRFEDSGNGDRDEGVIVKNFDILCPVAHDSVGIKIYNEVDFITIDNNHINGCGIGIYSAGVNTVGTRVALETVGELTFVHNAGVGGDTITRTTGTWSAAIKTGDSLQISSGTTSANLNKKFRIESGAGTATLTISDYPTWDVADEVVTSPNTTIYTSDGINSNLLISNNLVENSQYQGFLGTVWQTTISSNEFINNGFGDDVLYHNVYLSKGNYGVVDGNRLDRNSIYQGTCAAANLVGHKTMNNLTISNNIVTQPVELSGTGCWGIAIDNGNAEFEEFRNLSITGNTVINPGNVGIGCTHCVDTLIDSNTIIFTKTTGTVRGVVVQNKTPTPQYGDPATANLTVTNNKILNKGDAGLLSTSIGISVSTSSDTSGFANINSNIIDNFYTCINNGTSTGWTIDQTGNTKTNCTTGY